MAMRGGRRDPNVRWEVTSQEGGIILKSGVFLAAQFPGKVGIRVSDPRKPSNQTIGEVLVEPLQVPHGDSRHAELLDPQTLTWSPVGALRHGRIGHTATLLPDGRVLILGGAPKSGTFATSSAEVFDPQSGAFRSCRTTLAIPREGHTATLLKDGRVLVIGGVGRSDPWAEFADRPEVFDPKHERTQILGKGPSWGKPLRLEDGRVLVVGDGLVLLDPGTGQIISALSGQLRLVGAQATQLRDGKVLILGGAEPIDESTRSPLQRCLIFDPKTCDTIFRGDLGLPRWDHLLWAGNRELWLVGGMTKKRFNPPLTYRGTPLGYGPQFPTDSIETFDPVQWEFRPGPTLSQPMSFQACIELGNGRWLKAGGVGYGECTPQTWIIELPAGRVIQGPPMSMPRRGHTLTLLQDGRVLAVGGLAQDPPPLFPGASEAFSRTSPISGGRP